jgi:hypothetical protein
MVIELIDDLQAEILRRKSPDERLRLGCEMWEFARAVVTAAVRERHPDWDEARQLREIIRRLSHGAV